ncbi:unnamed protein product [Arabidopsis thaliana]|uniref:(thale cress) hypothetical protein n=1 Tax=Arabidopsis thaliana TaxID=3702 RepID=A0A7G2EW18_ARATH|nr:unnamed protein product [Arabidopsis thaliana]
MNSKARNNLPGFFSHPILVNGVLNKSLVQVVVFVCSTHPTQEDNASSSCSAIFNSSVLPTLSHLSIFLLFDCSRLE